MPFAFGGQGLGNRHILRRRIGHPLPLVAMHQQAGRQGQWVADSAAHYVAIAQALAAEGKRHQPQRLHLRQQLQASPLADGARLTRELERIYRELRQAVRGL